MRSALVLAVVGLAAGAGVADAEPMFLSKQYARCTTCHYSPSGGGLLTPYGRSLSRQELSTTGHGEASPQGGLGKEEQFLWGLTGNALGPVSVGIELRPSHLNLDVGGTGTGRGMLMTADILAAYRANGWTLYGQVGREPLPEGSKIVSYEHWVGYESGSGLGFRVGRFLPAYGIQFADHTAYTRSSLGFDFSDQVYALELSQSGKGHLLQLSVGPGRADSVIQDDGRAAFTATGRFQLDLSPRSVLVASGLYRDSSRIDPKNGGGGLAFGFAPTRHVSVWTEADAQARQGTPGAPAYTLLNETGVEVYRGVWLKFSPQLRTDYGDTGAGLVRMAFEANLLPRTHWNVDLSYYRDRNRVNDLVIKTFLAQLHLYL